MSDIFGTGRRPRARTMAGVYRGKVTRLTGTRPHVEIPDLAPDREFGPLDILEGPWAAGVVTDSGGAPAHTHGAGRDLAAGDRVLVAFVNGNLDRPIVLGRLAT